MKGLQGKVAIVPGGATKIGQAVVQAFTDAGVRVMVADIAAEAGRAMERDGVAFQACDLRRDAEIAALVAATKKKFGRIDFLVNVACSYLDNGAASTRSASICPRINIAPGGSSIISPSSSCRPSRVPP